MKADISEHPSKEFVEKAKNLSERTKQLAKYVLVKVMEDRDAVSEDKHQCNYCTDFAYCSMIHC